MANIQSYSSKSTALRGAKRAGMENAVAYESEGRWFISDASEVLGKDDFEATPDELAAQAFRPSNEEDVSVSKPVTEELVQVIDSMTAIAEQVLADKVAEILTTEKAPAKLKSYKQVANYDKSSKEKPVAFIHEFLSANPKLSRKEAVIALTSEHGINYSTARTQYQRWFTANKAAK
ncbi:hypothetical protein EVC02_056 [Rhizobium phage RHph_N17]|nr:hypothetical protein EVC02_056 [Rhizobium phage RHph_N17]